MNRKANMMASAALLALGLAAPEARAEQPFINQGFIEAQRQQAAERNANAVRMDLYKAMHRQRVLFQLAQSQRISLQGDVTLAAIRNEQPKSVRRDGLAQVEPALAQWLAQTMPPGPTMVLEHPDMGGRERR